MPACEKCGKQIMVGARMCIYCGAEVAEPICPVEPMRPKQNRTLVILLCCAIALALVLLGVLLAIWVQGSSPSADAYQPMTLPENATITIINPGETLPTKPGISVDPTDPPEPDWQVPCTKVTMDTALTLGVDIPSIQLSYSVEPIDTTDTVKFFSSDTSVATVDHSGRVTAHSTGKATIYLTCGKLSTTCSVICYMHEEPTPDDEPMPDLKLRMTDCSFNAKGYEWRSFERTEGFDETKFTWTMDDESVAVVDNGFVTTVAPGRTTMRVYYKGELVATCIIRCIWTEEPEFPEETDEPSEPVEVNYLLKINNANPPYKYNNLDNSADMTLFVGQKFRLTLVEKELSQIMTDVVWIISDETVCQMDGDYVVGLKKGTCKITCEYNGVTYLVYVRVTN